MDSFLLYWHIPQYMHLRVSSSLSIGSFPFGIMFPTLWVVTCSRIFIPFLSPGESPGSWSHGVNCSYGLSVASDFFAFVDTYLHRVLPFFIPTFASWGLLGTKIRLFCYYLSPFYPVETKILTFTSPAKTTLNRDICKTLILTLRSLMAS